MGFGRAWLTKRNYFNKIVIRYPKQVSPYVVRMSGEKFMEESTMAKRMGHFVKKSAFNA
jgi:hypothetical protein